MKERKTYLAFVIRLLCVFCLSCPASCVKEKNEPYEILKNRIVTLPPAFFLPVNLSPYGFLNPGLSPTKSGNTPGYLMPPLDSLLDWREAKQESSPDGLVYTQVPFRQNSSATQGALSKNRETLRNFVVPLKCFYIIFENCILNKTEEFIVTIIPSRLQMENDPGYDFLEKPDFDGIILYSTVQGEYLSTQFYSSGLIREGYLLKEDCDTVRKTYIGFYNTGTYRTKSVPVKTDTLDWVFVSAQGRYKHDLDFLIEDLKEQIGEQERPIPGGGGGETVPPPNPPQDMGYRLTITQKGCKQGEAAYRYEKGSLATLQAASPDKDCIFLCWTEAGLILSNQPALTLTMEKDRSLGVTYVSKDNPECYRLARLATDTTLMKQIQSLRKQTGNTKTEHAASERADGTYHTSKGGKRKYKYKF